MNIGPRRLKMPLTEEEAFAEPPFRRTLCPAYEKCLDYAAESRWTSFTCRGCCIERLILMGKVKEFPPPRVNVLEIIYQESPLSRRQYH